MKLALALLFFVSVAHAADCTRIGNQTICSDGRSSVDIGNMRMHSNGRTETYIGNQTLRSDGTSAVDIGNQRYDNGPAGNSTQIGNIQMYNNGVTCQMIGSVRICD